LLAAREAISEAMRALVANDHSAVVRLAMLRPPGARLIEDRGILLVTSDCAGGLPIGAVPVDPTRIAAVKRILAQWRTLAMR
jgi:hypothetical protein